VSDRFESLPPQSSPLAVRGCVLAGGAGRRLGRPKATAPLGDRPLISYPLAALTAAGLEPVVVAKASTELPETGGERWLEPERPRHPLVGIVEALRRAAGPVLVCACDMPFVTPELAAWLASLEAPAVIPRVEERAHPLLARYSLDALPPLSEAVGADPPLATVVAGLGPRYVDENELRRFGDPSLLLANVNDGADLARAESALAAG
jgi:molybdopterin-guanine dinucleotide biosynthesis protein A